MAKNCREPEPLPERVITRDEAIGRGMRRFFTGQPCVYGHVGWRRVKSWQCLECRREYLAGWRKRERTTYIQHMRTWRKKNPDRQAAHQGEIDAQRRAPGCVPESFDFEATIPIYAAARRLTRETGTLYCVDHIAPLARGGLHSAENLQVLTAWENALKGDH